MSSANNTIQVTVYPTAYGVASGVPGPVGPIGPNGIGFQPLNFTGTVVVDYGNQYSVIVDVLSAQNALTVGNTVKISFPVLATYLYGTITDYSFNSLTFLQLSGTAIPGTVASAGTIVLNGLPGEISAYTFDGGSPSSVYTSGPAFDCGGVN
jgi:hypothetical protein